MSSFVVKQSQSKYSMLTLDFVVVMYNFAHLDESIVTPTRARLSKLLNGADSVYRATRVRFSSSSSVCNEEQLFLLKLVWW